MAWAWFLVGGGALAAPLEAFVARTAGTGGLRRAVARTRRVAGGLALGVVGVSGVLALALPTTVRTGSMLGAVLGIVIWLWLAPTRGQLMAEQRFVAWGLQAGLEGASRFAVGLVLFALAVDDPGLWGLAMWVPVLFAGILSTWLVGRRPREAHTAPTDGIGTGMGAMLVVGAAQQFVLNSGPVLVYLRSDVITAAAAGVFLNTLSIARLPLLPVNGIQGAWLPSFGAAVASLDRPAKHLRHHLVVVGTALASLSLLCLLCAPFAYRILTGQSGIPWALLVSLVVATATIAVAQSLTLGCYVVGSAKPAGLAWCLAALVLLVVGLTGGSPMAVALGTVLGALLCAGILAAVLGRSMAPVATRRPTSPARG